MRKRVRLVKQWKEGFIIVHGSKQMYHVRVKYTQAKALDVLSVQNFPEPKIVIHRVEKCFSVSWKKVWY